MTRIPERICISNTFDHTRCELHDKHAFFARVRGRSGLLISIDTEESAVSILIIAERSEAIIFVSKKSGILFFLKLVKSGMRNAWTSTNFGYKF